MVPWNVQETPEPAASGHCSSVSDTSRGKYILSHSHISRFSSSSPIFSAYAINLLCIPNLQVVFSCAELRAPSSLWFPELAGSWSQTLQLAWNSRDQSRPAKRIGIRYNRKTRTRRRRRCSVLGSSCWTPDPAFSRLFAVISEQIMCKSEAGWRGFCSPASIFTLLTPPHDHICTR